MGGGMGGGDYWARVSILLAPAYTRVDQGEASGPERRMGGMDGLG